MTIAPSRHPHLEGLARKLAEAWQSASQIEGPTAEELPEDRAQAYFIQDRMAAHLGLPLSGWKVGATSARMRELDGHDDVIPGRIFQPVTFLGATQQLPVERFPHARAETEFAFRLQQDCPLRAAPWTAEELANQVVLHPAIEIIGNRHTLPNGTQAQRSLMTIADNGGGIGFVFGDACPDWQSIDFRHHRIRLRVDQQPEAENFLGDLRGEPLQALADLLNHLSGRGIPLHAGDFVSTGAATIPQPIQAGSVVQADFGTIGSITLNFTSGASS
jgi:2-keto-4-pentenoate hydratase